MTPVDPRLEAILSAPVAPMLAASRERFQRLHGPGETRVVLWGAGPLGRLALEGLRRAGVHPVAVCDRDPERWNQHFHGHAILSPREALDRFGRSAVFVPTVYTNQRLLAELGGLGVRAVPLALLAWQFPDTMLPHGAMDLPVRLHREAGQVSEALGLWADEASRAEFLGQVRWRAQLDASGLCAPLAPAAMFQPAELAFGPDEHFVDGGAFDGDTIRSYLRHHPRGRGPITAIEPDPITFQRLLGFLDRLDPEARARVRPVQAALGSAPGTLAWNATGTVVSREAEGGSCQVPVVRLDDLEAAAGATFIKLDVEGAER